MLVIKAKVIREAPYRFATLRNHTSTFHINRITLPHPGFVSRRGLYTGKIASIEKSICSLIIRKFSLVSIGMSFNRILIYTFYTSEI